jgi:hypothetical protein
MAADPEGPRAVGHELREQASDLRLAAERLPVLTTFERAETRSQILRHLHEHFVRHTKLDELTLYPEVATRLTDPLVATSMNYDRLAIRRWIELIAAADVSETERLQQLFYGLDALLRVHLWKQNELLLASRESSARRPPEGRQPSREPSDERHAAPKVKRRRANLIRKSSRQIQAGPIKR